MKRKHSFEWYYISMLTPGVIMLFIFSIIPMFGSIMAFQKYDIVQGWMNSKFVGFDNFKIIFTLPSTKQVIYNTLIIAVSKTILSIVVPVAFAILLNEARNKLFKRAIQTIVYLPNFLSWVIVAAIFLNLFSYSGVVNSILLKLGLSEPIIFMASNTWFRPIIIGTDLWKSFGFSAIIYISAITTVDPCLYESAEIDGAGRWQKIWSITLPCILPTIILMSTLALGNILSAGFDQIFNMYNPNVYQSGDILDTYVYRLAFPSVGAQRFDLATAIGLFKSSISFVLITVAYRLAYKFADYTIF